MAEGRPDRSTSDRDIRRVADRAGIYRVAQLKEAAVGRVDNDAFRSVALGDVAHVEMGQSPDSRCVSENMDVGLPFLQGNAEFGSVVPRAKFTCTAPMKMSEQCDLLISVRAPVGELNQSDRPYCIGRGLAAIRIPAMPASLAAHVVARAIPALRRVAQGTTFEAINKDDLRSAVVRLPPDQEQSVLARIIDAIDTAIHQTEAIIAKLKQVKQGLLHDLLTRGIDANGELRPPQSQAPRLYKPSPLGWIPKEWDVRPLSDYTSADITYGIVQAGPHVEGGVPYIRTGDMSGERLLADGLLRTSRRIADAYRRSEVRSGDIVIAIRATVGKVLPVPIELDGSNLTQGTARIAPNTRTDPIFLLWAIRHRRTQQSILAEIKGTTFAEITLHDLRKVPVAAPLDLNEQRVIGERMSGSDELVRRESALLAKLTTQKSGLMDDLLTGRVRVTPLLEAAGAP